MGVLALVSQYNERPLYMKNNELWLKAHREAGKVSFFFTKRAKDDQIVRLCLALKAALKGGA